MNFQSENIAYHRNRLIACKAAANVIMPELHTMTEFGRRLAASSITELDVTANFTDAEDKIIALFGSLACEEGFDTFISSDLWSDLSPRDMVYKRLFTEVRGNLGFNKSRFKKLMDILWQWYKDYGSVYDAFDTLAKEDDLLTTLKWMIGEQYTMQKIDYRLARFLMALFTNDEGIGQGIILYAHPENLTVPHNRAVVEMKKTFSDNQDVTYGEVADIIGLQYETDLYYTALAMQDFRARNKNRYACVQRLLRNLQSVGGRDNAAKDSLRRIFRDECANHWNK